MITATAAVPLLPFLAAVVGMLFGRRLPFGPAGVAIAGTGASAVLALLVLFWADGVVESGTVLTPTGGPDIVLGTRIDETSAVVAVMVTLVALAIQIYSVGYLRGDPRYCSYAAFMSLFTAAMLLVVLSADLLVLYVGWEVMGICSYFLIGHHWEERANSAAAVKAFLVTRTGDLGMLFGIFTLGMSAGSFRVTDLLLAVPRLPNHLLTVGTLLIVVGVVGKSAQFPLHTWLPDAMAGPAPVSALIHAATMVAAGIVVIARLYPAFLAAPATMAVLGLIAAISMLGSALAALAQDDIKRVLAYSTISQLAIMVGALAVAAEEAAIFHLLAHAAFKALLFLCAGAVIIAAGSNLLSAMGGLRRGMPVTFATMTIGFAALAGLPPTSGFFSKDAVIVAAGQRAGMVAAVLYVALLATVLVTAAYATRAWLGAFFGPTRGKAREVPLTMRVPLIALAIPALGLGFTGGTHVDLPAAALSVGLGGAGALLAYVIWRREPAADPARALGALRSAFGRAFYVDEAYAAAVIRPTVRLAQWIRGVDDDVVDAAVVGTGRGATRLAGLLRLTQTGNTQGYATGVLAGVVGIAVAMAVLS
ncbi:NADH-quinone oxidoreductase subunit 5 family protein [Mycobacterium sp.]|uniref:NADH-quinone oxidoreductase subunit 5 family protein n=1 Tax=Mycobacterium sp. TaxID=1785 RepID=UPI003D6B934C